MSICDLVPDGTFECIFDGDYVKAYVEGETRFRIDATDGENWRVYPRVGRISARDVGYAQQRLTNDLPGIVVHIERECADLAARITA